MLINPKNRQKRKEYPHSKVAARRLKTLTMDETPINVQTIHQSEKISLLNTPGELRDMIWSYVLKANYEEVLLSSLEFPWNKAWNRLKLLRHCRQVSEEAILVLYRENFLRLAAPGI